MVNLFKIARNWLDFGVEIGVISDSATVVKIKFPGLISLFPSVFV